LGGRTLQNIKEGRSALSSPFPIRNNNTFQLAMLFFVILNKNFPKPPACDTSIKTQAKSISHREDVVVLIQFSTDNPKSQHGSTLVEIDLFCDILFNKHDHHNADKHPTVVAIGTKLGGKIKRVVGANGEIHGPQIFN
jgi:hypothetical protein